MISGSPPRDRYCSILLSHTLGLSPATSSALPEDADSPTAFAICRSRGFSTRELANLHFRLSHTEVNHLNDRISTLNFIV